MPKRRAARQITRWERGHDSIVALLILQAINEKVGEQRDLQKQGQDIQLELKEMEHKVSKFQKDSKEAATKVWFASNANFGRVFSM